MVRQLSSFPDIHLVTIVVLPPAPHTIESAITLRFATASGSGLDVGGVRALSSGYDGHGTVAYIQ